ncbi:hypothetical protein D9M68_986990 [compost metagenome]
MCWKLTERKRRKKAIKGDQVPRPRTPELGVRMVLVATPVLAVSSEYRVATPMVVADCEVT